MSLPTRSLVMPAGILVFSSFVLSSVAAAQGETGFLRGAGRADIALTYGEDSYDQFWVGNVRVSDPGVGEITRRTVSLYTAYGLSDDTDLVFGAAWVEASSDGAAGFPDESDLQDATIGLKHAFWRTPAGGGEFTLLAAPGVKLPMSDYEDDAVTAIGDGQVDLRARVIGHWRHTTTGIFASLETGYDRRNGAPDDEIPFNLTLGFPVFDRVTIMPFYSRTESLGGIDISEVPAQGGFPSVEEDVERYGVQAYARLGDSIGLTAGWRTTIDGTNTGDADTWSLGLVLSL